MDQYFHPGWRPKAANVLGYRSILRFLIIANNYSGRGGQCLRMRENVELAHILQSTATIFGNFAVDSVGLLWSSLILPH